MAKWQDTTELPNGETYTQFHARLHRAKLFRPMRERAKALVDAKKARSITIAEAMICWDYPIDGPVVVEKVDGQEVERASADDFTDNVPVLESLQWAMAAIGVAAGGKDVRREDAPGPVAWALFQESDRDKLHRMWLEEGRRQVVDTGETEKELRIADDEFKVMLDTLIKEVKEEEVEMVLQRCVESVGIAKVRALLKNVGKGRG